ncbi:GntR family transcriptional regulator [Rubrobacter taiwanensis]|uniref:GntR family transcriptional regulator n=1 Tax=Rubrobacter taiwanensis TaxID=185139 RepID=A0A4R1BL97_9ACTN|nr:GntR family transcriptional regulator [Rubrobacter taiwanensis]
MRGGVWVVSEALRDGGRSGVLESIRHSILVGEYGPGERLVEEQLARRLGVSRTPVRQALAMLEAEGLVEIAPNRGAMVCGFTIEEVWDIYDLRAVLEGHAARRAAARIRAEELERLGALCEQMESVKPGGFGDREEEIRCLVRLNNDFHGAIVEASRNRRLRHLVQRTVQLPLVFKAFFWYTPEERFISNHYHRQILRALEQGDAERAEIVMREHVYEGRDFVIRALEEERENER